MERINSRIKAIRTTLHRELTRDTESPHKLASAIGLGIGLGITPIWGFQTLAAIGLAYVLRLNKPLALLGTGISLSPLLPLILYWSYLLGGIFLSGSGETVAYSSSFSLDSLTEVGSQYAVGALALAVLSGLSAYAVTRLWFWLR
jgi:uncharacterized protein (DUF2062 family)